MTSVARALRCGIAVACCRPALLAGLGGCATGPNANPRDPFEPFNRAVMEFNEGVDAVALKPAATVYGNVLPPVVRTGVSNFFSNLGDAVVVREQRAAIQVSRRGREHPAVRYQYRLRIWSASWISPASSTSSGTRKTSARPWVAGACRRSVPGAAVARPVDRARYGGAAVWTVKVDPLHWVDPWQPRYSLVRPASGGHPLEPAARRRGPGRSGARQVQLLPRCPPAKTARQHLREQQFQGDDSAAGSRRPTASAHRMPGKSRPSRPDAGKLPPSRRMKRRRLCPLLPTRQIVARGCNRRGDSGTGLSAGVPTEARGTPRLKRKKKVKRRVLVQVTAAVPALERDRPAAPGACGRRGARCPDQAAV